MKSRLQNANFGFKEEANHLSNQLYIRAISKGGGLCVINRKVLASRTYFVAKY